MRSLVEEHVLGAAQADPLRAEVARPGARRPACPRWCAPADGGTSSAHSMSVSRLGIQFRVVAAPGTSRSTLPVTIPVGAVDGDPVAFLHGAAADRERLSRRSRSRQRRRSRRRSTCPFRAPPRPRARSCRRVAVRIASAACMPAMSSGEVSLAHQDDRRPSFGHAPPRSVGAEDDLALPPHRARPGRPCARTAAARVRDRCGVEQLVELRRASTRSTAVFRGRSALRPPCRRRCVPRPWPCACRRASAASRAFRPRW